MKNNNEITILIIDDSPEDRETIKRFLSNSSGTKYQFLEVGTGKKGLDILEKHKPDCILLDFKLPDTDGISFIKVMVDEHKLNNIPIILLTGQGNEAIATDALKAGAQDYLIKDNLNSDMLTRSIRYAIEKKQAERELLESEESLRIITASAYDAIIMMDNEGKISFWNKAAEKLFGYSKEEAIGKDLHKLIVPGRFHEDYSKGFETFKVTGQGPIIDKVLALQGLRKDGKEFYGDHSFSAINIKGKWHAISIVRDITERKQTEEELRERNEELERFHRVTVGRELDMIKLKEEVNNLLEKSGHPKKYEAQTG